MTNISWWLWILPFIPAFMLWLAIRVALKLLFHPRLPKKIPGFTVQGVFPEKQRQIAGRLGKSVVRELVSFIDLERAITDTENVRPILPLVEEHIDHFLRHKLKESMPMIALFVGDKTIAQLKAVFMQELETLFPVILKAYLARLRENPDLERIIVDGIAGFSGDRLAILFRQFFTKEIRVVEVIGAALGFLIGLIQAALIFFIR